MEGGLLLLLLLFIVAISQSQSQEELHIINAERRIDLSSHIVKVFLTLKVQNAASASASAETVLVAFPPTQVEHIALLKAASVAAAAKGKKKTTSYVPLTINPSSQSQHGTHLFPITLHRPLLPSQTVTLELLFILTHTLEPFPQEITQSDPQLVYYRDTAIIFSPYPIKQQITYIKTPTTRIESYTFFHPTKQVSTDLTYGPYSDQPPYSYFPITVHFENNHPFSLVHEFLREIEVSHWGTLQITDHYILVHAGARHTGVFSRVEYQSRPSISGRSSFKHLLVRLPPRVHSVYYRDGIGNISTSHLRLGAKKSELEIEPRYPLFGGWKATFVIGYGLPLQDFLFESSDGRRYLNFSFGCPLADTTVEKLTIRVVLPEGSKNANAVVPFTIEQHMEKSYSYLDVVGRPVVVLEKKNVVPDHNTHFQVYYNFKPILMLAEPLMLAFVFFLFFVASVAYLHIDLSIRKS